MRASTETKTNQTGSGLGLIRTSGQGQGWFSLIPEGAIYSSSDFALYVSLNYP